MEILRDPSMIGQAVGDYISQSSWGQCCHFVNNVRYVFDEVHAVESARAHEGVEHGYPFGLLVRTEEQ